MEHLIPATVSQHGSRMMKRIEVVAAIIHDAEGRIFATQRGYGEFKDGWEFPGGKIIDKLKFLCGQNVKFTC